MLQANNSLPHHHGGGVDIAARSKKGRPGFKTVLLGEAAVGKSSLVMRLCHNTFTENMATTIGAGFFPFVMDLDGRTVKFEIWDTAGQERFASLAPFYYRGAVAAVVVYDQTRFESFERAQMWVRQLQDSLQSNIIIVLAANKLDLPSREVDIYEAMRYAEEKGLTLVETSAKTGENVAEIFECIARRLPSDPSSQSTMSHQPGAIQLEEEPQASPQTSGWCCSR